MWSQNTTNSPYFMAHESYVTKTDKVTQVEQHNSTNDPKQNLTRSASNSIFHPRQISCTQLHTLHIRDQCDFVRSTEECHECVQYIDYLDIIYCSIGGSRSLIEYSFVFALVNGLWPTLHKKLEIV